MGNKRVPEIRFPGFTGDWEQDALGNFGYFFYGKSAPKWSVTEDAETPCVRYGELYTKYPEKIDNIYSYTNIPKEKLKFSTGNEVLVPRVGEDPLDFANCSWLSIPNVAIGEMISVYNTDENPLFTSYMFNSKLKYEFAKRVEGGNVSNLYYSYLEDILIFYPSLREQVKIVSFMEELSNIIVLHQQELETLKQTKQGFLQKMFPKKGESVPAIRFPGFTGDWEQKKLSEFADKSVDNRGKTPPIDSEGNHPLIEVASLGNGNPDYTKVSKYLNDYSFENHLRGYIKKGDILFSTVGSIGLVSLMDNQENAAIAQNIVAFRAKENYISEYLYALFSTEANKSKAQRIVMGAVQPSIKVSQLVDVKYLVTNNMREQKLIGTFFLEIDKLITFHQQELEVLKQTKKAFLQKMFV